MAAKNAKRRAKVKVRRTWAIKPATRVVESRKKYRRVRTSKRELLAGN